MYITAENKQSRPSRSQQAPRSAIDTNILTMLDIFDAQLVLVCKKARDKYIEAAEMTARRYGVSFETMPWAKVLILKLRLYRTGHSMAPRETWADERRQAEQFFATHDLRST